jgi:DNA-binding transcriptional ArsR family regulator
MDCSGRSEQSSAYPVAMSTEPQIALIGAALAHDKRVALLSNLQIDEELTAGALARAAHLSAPAATAHLLALREAGLVVREQHGREHLYRLASPTVAALLEDLARLARPVRTETLRDRESLAVLQSARTCYDHLAGRLGVEVFNRLIERGTLLAVDDGLRVSDAGEAWFADLGIDLGDLRRARRPLLRGCLDWTERQPHLAGALGAALREVAFDRGWIRRVPLTRAVTVTRAGGVWLGQELGLESISRSTPQGRRSPGSTIHAAR